MNPIRTPGCGGWNRQRKKNNSKAFSPKPDLADMSGMTTREDVINEMLADLNTICRDAHRRMVAAQDSQGVDSDEARAAEAEYDRWTEERARVEEKFGR
jgi:hypothetical protein